MGVIALHHHVVGPSQASEAIGQHGDALAVLPYLPIVAIAALVSIDLAARLDVPGAGGLLARYQRAPWSRKLAALLMAVSGTVHLAIAPAHSDPPLAILFLLDGASYGALVLGALALPRWRSAAAGLLAANLAAYAGCLAAGLESADAVGVGTKVVEGAALTLVVVPPRDLPTLTEVLELVNIAKVYAIAFGVVYTIVGLTGFAVSTTLDTANLVIFPVNVLHNVVHLLVGLAGIAAFLTARSQLYARGMAILFAVLTPAGFLPQPLLGLVPLGGADIVLHALTAILAALAGWAYARPGAVRHVPT